MRPILLVGIGLLIACASEAPPGEGPVVVRAEQADPEMCAEHGVLEAVCTKCNAALVPVFQANGDWCAEHGFPESFCPICSPEAGGRPPTQDLSVDGAPADGVVVRFKTRDAAQIAGLVIAEAVEVPWSGGVEAVARIGWDATRVALVSARSPGVLVSIAADVGARVAQGDRLGTVRSAHVAGDRSRVSAAQRAVRVAEAELLRKQDLLASGVTSEREVLAAEQGLAMAEADLGALQAEIGLVGGGDGDAFAVTAPFAGVVTERFASVGESADPSRPLFQVVDASRMWAELDIPEAALVDVSVGQPVRVVLDALPGRTFEGTLDYLAPSVDARTRTARARVVLDNPDGALRANLYGTARVVTASEVRVVTVPSAAVQSSGDAHLVFVREAEDRFVGRRVRVLARQGGQVRIEGPVAPGDPVVTTGSFLLKTETLKSSIGAGCCDVD